MKYNIQIVFLIFIFTSCINENKHKSLHRYEHYFKSVTNQKLYICQELEGYTNFHDTLKLPLPVFFQLADSAMYCSELKKWCDNCSLSDLRVFPIGKVNITGSVAGYIVLTKTHDKLLQRADLFIVKDTTYLQVPLSMLNGSEAETEMTDCCLIELNGNNPIQLIYHRFFSYHNQNDSIISKDSVYAKIWDQNKECFTDYMIPNDTAYLSKIKRTR